MSAISQTLGRGSLLAPLPLSWGHSKEAGEVDKRIARAFEHFLQPLSITRVLDHASSALNAATANAAEENWDSYGGRAVDPAAYAYALRFLALLPTLTPLPMISVDPDGEISVSWDLGKDRVFSVSVGRAGRLSYAGLFGSSRSFGTEWLGSEIPKPILDAIARLFAAPFGRTERT